jgi:GMP synthase (glutamine-hydrolysing)
MILVVDFGSQTAHLIVRRIREFGISANLISPEDILPQRLAQGQNDKKVKGIIFSGGPASVYEKNAPTIDKRIFDLGIPILGICYGQQLTAYLLGGNVKKGKIREDGPATLKINTSCPLFASVSPHSRIWMSHGDTVLTPPRGFSLIGESEGIKSAAMANEKKKIYGVQFHPEVEHTEHGNLILKNFLEKICKVSIKKQALATEDIIVDLKMKIGKNKAIAAVSGGLDSTVAATLAAKAIGKNLIPIHVESGLMRKGTTEKVVKFFNKKLHIKPVILKKQKEFLSALAGKSDPEEKRKAIGKLYIDLFQEECKKYKDVKFLVQGTIYSDVIESKGTKHSANIKSHHNVGGLPENLKLTLVEPIRHLYTDQVRVLAKEINIPDEIIRQQPHPGPGYAIRILGEVSKERLILMQKADEIVIEEIKSFGWYNKLLHSFPVLTGARSTSVKGDGRVYGEVVAIRAVTSIDRMTADWAKLPPELLQKITSRITNEIPEISRVVYDITTKPPATMEWE